MCAVHRGGVLIAIYVKKSYDESNRFGASPLSRDAAVQRRERHMKNKDHGAQVVRTSNLAKERQDDKT